MSRSNKIADLIDNNGDIKAGHLDNISVTPTSVSNQANTSTGYFDLPSGTTAQRPTLGDNAGGTRYNTTTGSLEFYDGTNWVSTNLIPSITSITGIIVATVTTTLTLSVSNATDTIDVKYYESGTLLATDTNRTVSGNSATSTVPSAVYGQTVGDTISIQVFNSDGTPSSNLIDKEVLNFPSGGLNANGTSRAVATSGNYRYHAFLTSGTGANGFVNTIPNLKGEYLIVAGGGGGGMDGGGGGGGGGVLQSTFTSLSTGNKDIVVGGGGTGAHSYGEQPGSGTLSSALGVSTVGGGGAAKVSQPSYSLTQGLDGGSGGGGMTSNNSQYVAGGNGTAGPPRQGYDGGDGVQGGTWDGAGGGGAGGVGASNTSNAGGNGGIGALHTAWASATSTGDSSRYAGGGGGANEGSSTPGTGGTGGGGDGASSTNSVSYGEPGTDNTGGGGGGGDVVNASDGGGNGGTGIVIIRYDITDLTS